jgi:hypothetical protein
MLLDTVAMCKSSLRHMCNIDAGIMHIEHFLVVRHGLRHGIFATPSEGLSVHSISVQLMTDDEDVKCRRIDDPNCLLKDECFTNTVAHCHPFPLSKTMKARS